MEELVLARNLLSWLWFFVKSFLIYPLASTLILIFTVAAYRLFFHPFSSVPGPRLAAISSVWYAVQIRNGQAVALGKSLHKKYGPVVRVGPNELWFNTKIAFKAIYSNGSGFEKSDFYLGTTLSKPVVDWKLQVHSVDSLDLLSERDMKRYRMQRRLIGPVYRPANVARHEASIDRALGQVLSRFREMNGREFDLKEWVHITVVECLGASVLSWSPGMLKKNTDWATSTHSYQGWRRKAVFGIFPLAAKLQLRYRSFGRIFGNAWNLTFQPPPNFRAFFPDVNKRVSKRIKAFRRGEQGCQDLAEDLIQLHCDKPEFSDSYLRKMIITNFGAGHETMASTVISLITMLGLFPSVYARLAIELRQHFGDGSASWASASSLPYLQAVIKESQRLNPVVSMSPPRKVPSPGICLNGYYIPAGATLGCNPIALHRNEDICGPNPDLFDPERWLKDDGRAKEIEMHSLSWGGGARTCPGRHLAEMMVWKIVAGIVMAFEIEVIVPPEGEMPAYFLSMMTGVKARLHPVDQGKSN
ncbi:unnamed protein product [Clonostachys chloroleuca]|uniref:Cytochrome P450 n=1 Tax=Clonostachys chloroleuca TaxID=1926264 RepID=A0AA35Q3T5_9HYPO|nr:unnamed protein product [Clonostachys chloroleuca]